MRKYLVFVFLDEAFEPRNHCMQNFPLACKIAFLLVYPVGEPHRLAATDQ